MRGVWSQVVDKEAGAAWVMQGLGGDEAVGDEMSVESINPPDTALCGEEGRCAPRVGGGEVAPGSVQSQHAEGPRQGLLCHPGAEFWVRDQTGGSGTLPDSPGSSPHLPHPLLSPSTLPVSLGLRKGPVW